MAAAKKINTKQIARKHLIEAVSKKYPQHEFDKIDNIVSCAIQEIERQLKQGHGLQLKGLGTFSVVQKKAMKSNLPQLANINVSNNSYLSIKFKVSPKIIKTLNNNDSRKHAQS